MTSDRLLTSPSLTPKMTARSVPDRPPVRCQLSPSAISAAEPRRAARRATPSPRGRLAPPAAPSAAVPDLGVLALVGRDRGDLGRAPWASYASSSSPSSACDQVGHGARPEQAGERG